MPENESSSTDTVVFHVVILLLWTIPSEWKRLGVEQGVAQRLPDEAWCTSAGGWWLVNTPQHPIGHDIVVSIALRLLPDSRITVVGDELGSRKDEIALKPLMIRTAEDN